jgi:hypothetical protein
MNGYDSHAINLSRRSIWKEVGEFNIHIQVKVKGGFHSTLKW